MNDSRDHAPWFPQDRQQAADYLKAGERFHADLCAAAQFFSHTANKINFPVGEFGMPVEISYIVTDGDGARAEFELLAQRVADAGGGVIHRPDITAGSMQHLATMAFGSGRVSYRVLWIEHGVTTTHDEADGNA